MSDKDLEARARAIRNGKILGAVLVYEREKRGLTLQDAAAAAGVVPGKLAQYETGNIRFPAPDSLIQLARSYELPDTHFLELVAPGWHPRLGDE